MPLALLCFVSVIFHLFLSDFRQIPPRYAKMFRLPLGQWARLKQQQQEQKTSTIELFEKLYIGKELFHYFHALVNITKNVVSFFAGSIFYCLVDDLITWLFSLLFFIISLLFLRYKSIITKENLDEKVRKEEEFQILAKEQSNVFILSYNVCMPRWPHPFLNDFNSYSCNFPPANISRYLNKLHAIGTSI